MDYYLRTPQCIQAYLDAKQSGQGDVIQTPDGRRVFDITRFTHPIADFQYWILVQNAYPYDRIAQTHHLLITKRIYPLVTDMNTAERAELDTIVQQLSDKYHCTISNFPQGKSIPDHYHLHFIQWKTAPVENTDAVE